MGQIISQFPGGGENVTPEVQTQTPLIEDIKESLVGKATGANATEDTILEGYSAYVGQELVVGKYKPHGLYVWKKYEYESSTVGDFVDYVVSDSETEYPDGDVQDGYWYEKIDELSGIDYGSITVSGTQSTITISHGLKQKPSRVFLYGNPGGIGVNVSNLVYFISTGDVRFGAYRANQEFKTISGNSVNGSISANSWENITADAEKIVANMVITGTYNWIAIA